MQIIEGKISKALKERITSSNVPTTIIGSFSSGTYLENEHVFVICDENYGYIPFGISIKNYKDTICKMDLQENYQVVLTKDYLQLMNANIQLQINFQEEEYCPGNGEEFISNNEFIDLALEKLVKTDKGTFVKFFLQERENNIYFEHLKKYLNVDEGIANNKDIEKLLENTIGLGPGLTPSGDDFLLGYLYQSRNNETLETKTIGFIKDYIKQHGKELTNTFSNLYYLYVLNGERFSLYDNVCFCKDKQSLSKAIEELLKVGSNSGADFLTGVLLARRER